MENTFQFEDIGMLEHGKMVYFSYQQLLKSLQNNNENYLNTIGFNLSEDHKQLLLSNQYNIDTMQQYQIYHDCGKPFCKTIDINGKNHYPNHAEKSYEIFKQYFHCETTANLILYDMCFHSLRGDDLIQWFEKINNKQILCSLYLTAWSEIIANSSMFGGIESDSYKIKKKRLIQNGKKLFEFLSNK